MKKIYLALAVFVFTLIAPMNVDAATKLKTPSFNEKISPVIYKSKTYHINKKKGTLTTILQTVRHLPKRVRSMVSLLKSPRVKHSRSLPTRVKIRVKYSHRNLLYRIGL